MAAISRLSPALLLSLAVFLVGWFGTLGTHRLVEPDEGRYAEIPREMARSGDWITPRLNGIKYFEKPPLQYWATAATYELFGTSEWSARLWAALTGFLGILLTVWLAARQYGSRTALLAGAVQAGSLMYVVLAHVSTLDMGLTFTLQMALSGLVLLTDRRRESSPPWQAVPLLAAGVALAFLSKGLIGILIPGAVAGIYVLVTRDWQLIWRSKPWWSLLALVAIAGPWLLAVSQHNPEFARFFFIHEHFARFLTRVHDRYHSDAFFIPFLLAGFLPWTPLLPLLALDAWRSWRTQDRVAQLLTIWVVFVFLFFSLSQSKLIPYILPLFPALALLAGRLLARLPARPLAWSLAAAAAFWLLIALAGTAVALWPGIAATLWESGGQARTGLITSAWAVALATALAAILAVRGRVLAAAWVAAAGSMLFSALLLASVEKLPTRQSVSRMIASVQPRLTARTRLYCVNSYHQSIPFYLGRTCTLVRYRGEMEFGLNQEPMLFIPDLERFAAAWRTEGDAVAFVDASAYEDLRRMNLPMRVLHAEPSLIAITP
ncbi:MAG: glycosyltransferase family 39 protein [Gammaproteobacteria bacterium]|nr:glycosyltransferase family 39 protein [Gammaproteobacteria bacterium]